MAAGLTEPREDRDREEPAALVTIPVLGHVPVAWPLATSSSWGRLSLRDTLTAETTAVQQMGTQLSVASVEGEWPRVLDKPSVGRGRQAKAGLLGLCMGSGSGASTPTPPGAPHWTPSEAVGRGTEMDRFLRASPLCGGQIRQQTLWAPIQLSCEWKNQGRGSTQPSAGSRETSEPVWTPVAITGAKGTSGETMVTVMTGAPDTGSGDGDKSGLPGKEADAWLTFKVLIRL